MNQRRNPYDSSRGGDPFHDLEAQRLSAVNPFMAIGQLLAIPVLIAIGGAKLLARLTVRGFSAMNDRRRGR